jgi:hypothetical protein
MPMVPVAPPSSRLTLWVCALMLLLAVAGQLHNGWILRQSSLIDNDPPSHFVSGAMVHDYLHRAAGSDPLAFAESYYVRYPKVAIGHWPPAYYGLQAVWYSLSGVHIVSARLLSAAIALMLALAIVWPVQRSHGTAIALGVGAVFLALPPVLENTWTVMSDLLTAWFVWLMLLAAVPLLDRTDRPADANDEERRSSSAARAVARMAVPGALALLTKGTAWALAPGLLIAPLTTRRFRAFLSGPCWASAALIVLLGAPFYLLARQSGVSYPLDATGLATAGSVDGIGWSTRVAFVWPVTAIGSPVVFLLAAIGIVHAFRARWQRGDESRGTTTDLLSAAFVIGHVLFFFVFPLSDNPRAWMASLPPLLLLMARGIGVVVRAWPARPGRDAIAVPILLGAAIATADFSKMEINPIEGYRAAASAIPYPDGGTLILIASDSPGEGAFIVERLVGDPARAGVVLRGDQTIADSNWSGSIVRSRFETPRAVRDRLVELQVRYVVLDSSMPPGGWPGRALLTRAVEDDPATFRLFGRFTVTDRLGVRRGELVVYENPSAERPREIRVRLGLDRGSRTLVYRWP